MQVAGKRTQDVSGESRGHDERLAGLLRLPQVLDLIPVSASTWWAGVKTGKFPRPVKLSERVTAWKVKDIRRVIDGDTDFSVSRP